MKKLWSRAQNIKNYFLQLLKKSYIDVSVKSLTKTIVIELLLSLYTSMSLNRQKEQMPKQSHMF